MTSGVKRHDDLRYRVPPSPRDTASSDDGARSMAALARRLDAIEASESSQAELASEMAKQLKDLTEALRVVALRVLVAIALSGVAVVLGFVALVRTLW
jgi:hypothetical protein